VESAAALMQRITFRVKKRDSFFFLMVDGADPGCTCFMSSRLMLRNVNFLDDQEECSFCVESKQLLIALENPCSLRSNLTVEGYLNDATVHIRVNDPDESSFEDESILSTFVEDEKTQTLKPFDFNMILEMDMSKLRNILKAARKYSAEVMTIKVYLKSTTVKDVSVVIFSVVGDSTKRQVFCNETSRDEDGSLSIKASAEVFQGDSLLSEKDMGSPAFEGVFPIDKFEAFVKHLQIRTIEAKIREGMPIMLNHKIAGGGEKSYIRFLIAPKNVDD
jgi:hypothetical protein